MACAAGAHGAVGGVVGVAADVADSGIQETFLGKVLAKKVFNAPEAAGGYRAFLSILRKGDGAPSRRV